MKRSKRNNWELIYEVLKATNEGTKKTRIQQTAYLNWRSFQKYFDFLVDNGYVAKCNNSPDNYEVTEKGKKLLKQLEHVEMLGRILID